MALLVRCSGQADVCLVKQFINLCPHRMVLLLRLLLLKVSLVGAG